ncbi:MAG: hypothetical protein ACRECY_18280 [Phyllobacterium sp.]
MQDDLQIWSRDIAAHRFRLAASSDLCLSADAADKKTLTLVTCTVPAKAGNPNQDDVQNFVYYLNGSLGNDIKPDPAREAPYGAASPDTCVDIEKAVHKPGTPVSLSGCTLNQTNQIWWAPGMLG